MGTDFAFPNVRSQIALFDKSLKLETADKDYQPPPPNKPRVKKIRVIR